MKVSSFKSIDSALVQEALLRFTHAWSSFAPLASHESAVYAWEQNGSSHVLKLIPKERRSREQLLGEIDFVQYVSANGIAVSRPLVSLQGEFVESIGGGASEAAAGDSAGDCTGYWAYAFEWAAGEPIRPAHYDAELYRAWGAAMGRLHSLAERYTPLQADWLRPGWRESELKPAADRCAGSAFPALQAAAEAQFGKLRQLPERSGEFGLIHNDMHAKNFHRSGNGIVLFDFDGLTHHHYASDIAVAYYYVLAEHSRASGPTRLFLAHFLNGYSLYRDISSEMQRQIPEWMKFRHIQLYMSYMRCWGERPTGMTERWKMSRYRQDIAEGTLFGRNYEDIV